MQERTINKVYIATSLDGYIADSEGKIDFLYAYPDPVDEDMGYEGFMKGVDALLMGRRTFETVLGFGIEWPYKLPVHVWTSKWKTVPPGLEGKIFFTEGNTVSVISQLHEKGYRSIYVDGGQVIQSLLVEDLIDEMTITTVPVLLGSGIPLFGDAGRRLMFTSKDTRRFSNGVCQAMYIRKRE